MASEFYLVLPSNSSMITHPNNTLAQYITNLPTSHKYILVFGECGLTEIHYPHGLVQRSKCQIDGGNTDGNMETDVCFEDGYYHKSRGTRHDAQRR